MKRSSEYINKGELFLISSPIGNLKDITFRAIEVIKNVDYLFCEDTRVTKKLLKEYNIDRTLDSFHDYSKGEKEDYIISLLKNNNTVGLISDAGTPVISDPGYELVRKSLDLGIKVTPIPGPSAQVSAMIMSGMPIKPYLFYGFLDHKISKKKSELESLKDYPFSMCFYESPLRINSTIELMFKIFGERNATLTREITKLYEETIEFNLSEYESFPKDLKGEMVLIVEGRKETIKKDVDIILELTKIINDGFSLKEATKMLSKTTGIKSSELYNEYLRCKKWKYTHLSQTEAKILSL